VAMFTHFDERKKNHDKDYGDSTSVFPDEKSHSVVADNNGDMFVAFTQLDEREAFSSRKFEALEEDIGWKLCMLSKSLKEKQKQNSNQQIQERKREKTNRQKVIRGLKIGTAGVVAGTLLAVTGGLAAPAVAAGIAAVAGGTVIATVATIALASTAAVSTVFGVGGGALVAAKMDKRTRGLTEFQIRLEEARDTRDKTKGEEEKKAELYRTLCISGWLRDDNDFRRPWGATLHEELRDKEKLLRWFFTKKDPGRIEECSQLITFYEGWEDELWSSLRETYGQDPDMLLSAMAGQRKEAVLNDWEDDAVNNVIEALGFPRPAKQSLQESSNAPGKGGHSIDVQNSDAVITKTTNSNGMDVTKFVKDKTKASTEISELWDFHAHYGGELYTVRWESEMIQDMSNSVKDFAKDLANKTTKEVLKHTAMAAVMTAIALPAGILAVANMIDGSWTIALERADEAGVELALSLLESNAGHRPISLVGYSLGARVIYKCLRELTRHQEKWEEQQRHKQNSMKGSRMSIIDQERSQVTTKSNDGDKEEITYVREPASIVEDVILMGCPLSVNLESWASCKEVIAGRFVNCFSREDMILTLMFRYKNIKSVFATVGGIAPVNISGIENYDVSTLIKSHSDYCFATKDILSLIGYDQPRLIGITKHFHAVTLESVESSNPPLITKLSDETIHEF